MLVVVGCVLTSVLALAVRVTVGVVAGRQEQALEMRLAGYVET